MQRVFPFRQAGTSLVGARGVEPPSPKALDSKSSAASIFATLLRPHSGADEGIRTLTPPKAHAPEPCVSSVPPHPRGTRRGTRTLTLKRAQRPHRCVSPVPPSGCNVERHNSLVTTL